MYTVAVVAIILFPWTLVGAALVGYLIRRLRRSGRVQRADVERDLRKVA